MLVCVRVEGAEGAVNTDKGEEAVEPYALTETTIKEYVVPGVNPVKVAVELVWEEGVEVEPFNRNV